MRRFSIIGLAAFIAVAVIAGGAVAGTSKTTKVIAFTAKYSGNATTQQNDSLVAIKANGSGTGTLLGAGKITGTGTADSSVKPCVPFTGPGSMTGKGGVLKFTVLTGSCGNGDEQGQVFALVGKAKVIGATGKLKKAKGTLKFTGTYDRGSGTFVVKFKGSLSI